MIDKDTDVALYHWRSRLTDKNAHLINAPFAYNRKKKKANGGSETIGALRFASAHCAFRSPLCRNRVNLNVTEPSFMTIPTEILCGFCGLILSPNPPSFRTLYRRAASSIAARWQPVFLFFVIGIDQYGGKVSRRRDNADETPTWSKSLHVLFFLVIRFLHETSFVDSRQGQVYIL